MLHQIEAPQFYTDLGLQKQCLILLQMVKLKDFSRRLTVFQVQSNLSYPNVDYPKLLGYSKTMDSPDSFPYFLLQ